MPSVVSIPGRPGQGTSPWRDPAPGPLSGLRVIDLTHVLAGPYATALLAMLGADVIKVEKPPVGDGMRDLGTRPEQQGVSAAFLGCNAGKRSLALDLATPGGRDVLTRLVGTADVFVENLRPGRIAALGFGPEQLAALNPALVQCSISAWGQAGPLAPLGGYDHVIQAATGMMALQGNDPAAPPVKVGFPVIDMGAALMAALAITAAVAGQRRGSAAQEARLDVSMADAALLLMAPLACRYTGEGRVPARIGNRGFAASPGASVFRTADGWLATAANTLGQFDALCRVIGKPDFSTAPDYLRERPADPATMLRDLATPRLDVELQDAFLGRGAAAWEAALTAAGVPAAMVRDLAGFLNGPYRATPGISLHVPGRDGIPREIFGPGFRGLGEASAGPAPRLGEHTDSVLDGLGYAAREVEALRAAGAVA
jgi:crotonobetainyl-CoA:carnitine CoA-transferase CaiB-like acyl-CoA transferase